MKLSTSLKLFSALAVAGSVFAQSEETPTSGTKSTVKLALTLTEEIGGFYIKDAQREAFAAKGITFDSVRNPRGFDVETAKANYYEHKHTVTYLAPGSEQETENSTVESRKLLTTKYANAQFLADLVAREIIPNHPEGLAKAIAGYSIVAVQFSYDDAPHFFVEKAGSAPIYVGRFFEDGDGYASENPLAVGSYGGVEKLASAHSTKTKYRKITEEGETRYEAIEPSTETYSESFSGLDDSYFVINRADGSSVSTAGTLKFSGRYDPKSDLIVTGEVTAAVAGSAGFESEGGEEEGSSWSVYAVAGGAIKLHPSKVVADLSAYEAALD